MHIINNAPKTLPSLPADHEISCSQFGAFPTINFSQFDCQNALDCAMPRVVIH